MELESKKMNLKHSLIIKILLILEIQWEHITDGHVSGINCLGSCYKDGIGIEKDEHKAFIYYHKSAEMGHAGGILGLAAEMGHVDGINNLGHCYQNRIGVEKDEYQATIYYEKLVELKHAVGIENLGDCYRNGIGVTRDIQKTTSLYQM
ncbi:HCP-like protein [Gigaspora margarita]|uniref:HCP-like protein n=1 Tax=Gigaspora margarita TaxID=4874 RepID=A0A8H4ENV5_GIGMA|nr:HCP-like protein [Gigaspora margarita]